MKMFTPLGPHWCVAVPLRWDRARAPPACLIWGLFGLVELGDESRDEVVLGGYRSPEFSSRAKMSPAVTVWRKSLGQAGAPWRSLLSYREYSRGRLL